MRILTSSLFDDLHFVLGENVDNVGQPVLVVFVEHLVLVVDYLVDVDGEVRGLVGEDPERVGPRELLNLLDEQHEHDVGLHSLPLEVDTVEDPTEDHPVPDALLQLRDLLWLA